MIFNRPNYPRPQRAGSGFKDNSNLDKYLKTKKESDRMKKSLIRELKVI